MRIIRRYAVDTVVAIGILTLVTTAVGVTARAGSPQDCVAYVCSGDDGCDTNCHCLFVVEAVGSCAGGGQ